MFKFYYILNYDMGKSIQPVTSTSGAKSQNTEWLASDITITDVVKLIITGAGDQAVDVQITTDSGTSWNDLISSTVVDEFFTKEIVVRPGDLVNFRTSGASGIDLDFFRVDKTTAN